MKYLKDRYGDRIQCCFCKKDITDRDEIEYSREYCEYYCCPDCATTKYYEYCESKPLSFEEAQEIIQEKIEKRSI